MVLALSNILRGVCRGGLTDIKLQTATLSRFNPFRLLETDKVPVHVHSFMLQPLCRNPVEVMFVGGRKRWESNNRVDSGPARLPIERQRMPKNGCSTSVARRCELGFREKCSTC